MRIKSHLTFSYTLFRFFREKRKRQQRWDVSDWNTSPLQEIMRNLEQPMSTQFNNDSIFKSFIALHGPENIDSDICDRVYVYILCRIFQISWFIQNWHLFLNYLFVMKSYYNEIIPYKLFVSLIYSPKNKNKIKRYKIPCMVRDILAAYFRKIKICH